MRIKMVSATALFIGAAVLCTACQAVFTYTPLEVFQRDISTLSSEQKVAYAEDLTVSGTKEEQAAAYKEISKLASENPKNPDLSLLAADLAIGASGVNEVVNTALEDPEALMDGGIESLETLLGDIDLDLVKEAGTHVANAETAGGEIDSSQYAVAGAAFAMAAVEEAGGVENLQDVQEGDAGYDSLQSATEYLDKAGIEDLLGDASLDASITAP